MNRVKHAQRRAFFCFVFFVATKKMTLLSGNPDGFVFVFRGSNCNKKNNRLTICCIDTTEKTLKDLTRQTDKNKPLIELMRGLSII